MFVLTDVAYDALSRRDSVAFGNGNLTTDHQGRSFSYDAENVLRAASGLTGGSASYRYHADGSRREKTHGGITSTFYYMGGLGYLDAGDTAFAADQEIAEYAGSGALQKRFVRLPGSIDEAFLMMDVSSGSAVETWAHTDRLGSVIATTDSTGAVNGSYRYSPYGRPGAEGSTGFPFRFTGQRLDAETGLYYYKARYYDPETGRFLQTDPIGYDDQMNLYAYVGNDPVNGIDPSGMSCAGTRLKSSSFCPGGRDPSEFRGRSGDEAEGSETDQPIGEAGGKEPNDNANANVPAGSLEFSFGLQGSLKLGAKGIFGASLTLNFSSIKYDVGKGEFGKEQEVSVAIDIPKRTLVEAGARSESPLGGRHEEMITYGGIWVPTDDIILEIGATALFGFDAEINFSEIGRRMRLQNEEIDMSGYPFEKPTR